MFITWSSRGGVGVWWRCWIAAFVLRCWGMTSLREANTPLESTWVKLFPSWLTGKLAKPGKRSRSVLPGCQEGNYPNGSSCGLSRWHWGHQFSDSTWSPDSHEVEKVKSRLFCKRTEVTYWLKTPQSSPVLSEGTYWEMVMVYSLRVLLEHSVSEKMALTHSPPQILDLFLNANQE